MTTVTNYYAIYSNGVEAKADTFGNNVAFACFDGGYPVLAIARDMQRGSSIENASVFRNCNLNYGIEIREVTQKIVIYRTDEL